MTELTKQLLRKLPMGELLLAVDQEDSQGTYTAPETRLLLLSLVASLRAKDVLELGTFRGHTAEVLSRYGCRVVTVDNIIHNAALERLEGIPSVEHVAMDAIQYLEQCKPESFDFTYVDDDHDLTHIEEEAVLIRDREILRPGGLVAFHDVVLYDMWPSLPNIFDGWEGMRLPAPASMREDHKLGLGLFRRPEESSNG